MVMSKQNLSHLQVSNENQKVVMKDAEITIDKVDEETEEPVLDAQFSVFV